MTALRAVLFDLDDTLFAHRAAVEAGILTKLRAMLGPDADTAGVSARWTELEERHYHRYLSGELTFLEQRRRRAREFAAAHGIPLDDEAADLWWEEYFEGYRSAWTLHDDALPCLDAIRRGIPGVRVGIITNGELDFQTRKLDAVELSARVDTVVASGDVGVAKPEARIFHLACERLGVAPGEAAYVGDRLRTDAIGAAHAGLTGVWLDRTAARISSADRSELADLGIVRVPTLADVPAVLMS